MSQQPVGLRRSFQIVRRYKILVGALAVAGLLIGIGYSVTMPPVRASTALVVLPQNTSHVDTQVVIATSDRVLYGALSKAHLGMPLQTLAGMVTAKSLTSGVIAITARAPTGIEAQAMANGVANSYISYVRAPQSPVGHIGAQILQPASTSSGSGMLERDLPIVLGGLLVGTAIGVVVGLVIAGRDRRLRALDDIANSIGVPVLAALPVEHPSDAAGWTKLLDEYEPSVVYAWRLRQALVMLGINDMMGANEADGRFTITVLSLSSDSAALALGPQIAAFAASRGIATVLVVGAQHDTDATAALRTACAATSPSMSRSPHLRTVVVDGGPTILPPGTRLAVTVVTVDGKAPELAGAVSTDATVLAVAAGSATAEQLARVATAAAGDGREISGIFVADPESADHTTGRVPPSHRSLRRMSPTTQRTGVPTETRR